MNILNNKYLTIKISDYEIDLSYQSDKSEESSEALQTLVTTLHKSDDKSLTLDRSLLVPISSRIAELIPKNLAVDVSSLVLAKVKHNHKGDGETAAKAPLVLVGDFGASISLADLPLVGKFIPPEQMIALQGFQLIYSTAAADSRETAQIQHNIPLQQVELPNELKKGGNFRVDLIRGDSANPKSLIFDAQNQQDDSADEAGQNLSDRPTTPTADSVPDQADDGTAWLAVNKSIGPLKIKRIGAKYIENSLVFLLDTAMKLGPMTVSLDGLGVSSPLDSFKPSFELSGLGLDYHNGSVEVSGSLLRKSQSEGKSFLGSALIKTARFNMAAVGAYEQLQHGEGASLFVYAVVDLPVAVGPAFFQVQGIAAGFGYNRSIRVPDIQGVKDFALVKEAMAAAITGSKSEDNASSTGADPINTLRKMSSDIYPAAGEMFMAFGLKFNSFKLIDSFALLILRLSNTLQMDVVGMSRLVVPAQAESPLAVIEVAIKATYDFEHNALRVNGLLTPEAYIFSKDCHLSGGFAFYTWFEGEHAGDFALTMGGYHPNYKVPDHYPKVPRLSLNWQIASALSVKGSMYYALVPEKLMAGGRLEALFEERFSVGFDIGIAGAELSGRVRANFVFGADFEIEWAPFHYNGHAYLSIGIQATFCGRVKFLWFSASKTLHFDLNLGANLHLWGPDFSGVAHIDWKVVSFDVEFGSGNKHKPGPLDWPAFRQAFLPDNNSDICTMSVAGGLIKELTTSQNQKIVVVHPAELSISVNSAVPANYIVIKQKQEAKVIELMPGANHINYSIPPMGENVSDCVFSVVICKGESSSCIETFTITPITKNVPSALWKNLNNKSLLMGFEIKPKANKKPDKTESKPVKKFAYDIDARKNAFAWQKPIALVKPSETQAIGFTSLPAAVSSLAPLAEWDDAGAATPLTLPEDSFLVQPQVYC